MIDGKTGMVVRQFNQSQLVRAMDFLTNDPSLMARYGREARSYAATQSLPASFNAFWHLHEFSAFHSNRKEVAA